MIHILISFLNNLFITATFLYTLILVRGQMAKSDLIEVEGEVVDIQRERFVVQTPNGRVLGYLAGRQKMNNIRIVLGDRVKVEVSPYDLTKGRIIYRFPAPHQNG